MASKVYLKGLEQMLLGNLAVSTDTLQALLVTDAYTFAETHNFVADVSGSEAAGANRPTLASKTVTIDTANGRVEVDCADLTFTSVSSGQTVGGVVFFKSVTNDADSYLLGFADVTDLAANGSDITYTVPADGFLQLTN
jgi:hypothetical protein